jgi:hypothetical protein
VITIIEGRGRNKYGGLMKRDLPPSRKDNFLGK